MGLKESNNNNLFLLQIYDAQQIEPESRNSKKNF